ncbi:MAG: hypothetical protein QG604_105 [Candidatus Dependentiae bacterium]|nr:hypothetical protein [Candidatus Dependentiae bacterium]
MGKRYRLLSVVLLLASTTLHLGARVKTAVPAVVGGGLAVGFYSKSREAENEAEMIKAATEAKGQDYTRSKKYQSACRRKRLFQVLAALSLAGGLGGSALMRRSDTTADNEIVPKRDATPPTQPEPNVTPKDTAGRKKRNAEALSQAIIKNDAKLVATLAKKAGKAKLMLRDEHGNTPLMLAIELGHVEVVRALVPLSGSEALRTTTNNLGRTSLAMATGRGDDAGSKMAQIITNALATDEAPSEEVPEGMDITATKKALTAATNAQDVNAIKKLNKDHLKTILNGPELYEDQPFFWRVIEWGNPEAVQYLIDVGGKEIVGKNPSILQAAVQRGRVDALRILAPLASAEQITDGNGGGGMAPLMQAKWHILKAYSEDSTKKQSAILKILEDELERKTGTRDGGESEAEWPARERWEREHSGE